MLREDVGSEVVLEVAMHFSKLTLSKGKYIRGIMLNGPSVEIVCEEDGDLISLQIFLVAVEFFVIFEQIDVEVQTALIVVLVKDGENLLKNVGICHFHRK